MPDTTTITWQQFVPYALTWAWVVLLSAAGGMVSFIQKLKAGLIKRFSLGELLGEMFIASFVGIITMLLCQWAELSLVLSAALVGLCGHMGSRALFVAEQVMSRKISKWFHVEGPIEQAQGPQGVPGDQGVRGVPGRQGVQGDRGDQGPVGASK